MGACTVEARYVGTQRENPEHFRHRFLKCSQIKIFLKGVDPF